LKTYGVLDLKPLASARPTAPAAAIASAPDGTIWALPLEGSEIVAYDNARLAPKYSVGGFTHPLAVRFDDRFAYVLDGGTNSLSVVDLGTHALLGSTALGAHPSAMAQVGSTLWILLDSKRIAIYDCVGSKVVTSVPCDGEPVSAVYAP
jgi:DNA-binding beta-propeller fold protein YncE